VTAGRLVVVATPLGNLGDLSPRAAEALSSADVIACEDTRRTGRLLELAGIGRRRMLVVNEHTEAEQVPAVLDLLGSGSTVVVVSDAGTPGISDPGEHLVGGALDAGFDVTTVPGPSAAVASLVVSGLAAGRFVFEGFLPRSGSGRRERLEALAGERRTMVLFEAPHRLERTLGDLAQALGGDRRVALVRELTKLHEEVWRGTLDGAVEHAAAVTPRGEYAVVVAGAPEPSPATDGEVVAALRDALAGGSSKRDAAAGVAAMLGLPRRHVYELAQRLPPQP
jgi:16S rRNA (cytidine1402-2'-O)-methyltransferase